MFLLVEDQLQNVEKQYTKNLQTENQKWSSHGKSFIRITQAVGTEKEENVG